MDKDKTKGDGEMTAETKKIRLTITSRDVKSLERTCRTILDKSGENEISTKGPVRIPTKRLHITTRKSPCGEGTNTWDHFEMRIHKRVIDLFCPTEQLKDVTSFKLDAGVHVALNVSAA